VLVGGADTTPDTDEFDVVARLSPEELRVRLDDLTVSAEHRWGVSGTGILLLADTRPSDELWDLVVRAGGAGLPVYVASPVRSVATDRLTTREIDGRTIVKVAPPALVGVRAFEKRAFDLAVSAIMLVVFAVPMAAIAAAVLISSGRPILYGQQRVGRAGGVFRMWKFRTMRVDAEAETGPVWATKDDPRRTRLGRVLRTWSLDELPQLWNVLIGDMSVVGPRPERPELVDEFVEGVTWYRHRHRIKPGITGLAQVSGLRGDTELAPRVDADNHYIEHWSLMLDVRIALRTVLEVIRHRNAG
jgi:exopolysaccharide biosynthesis polyprenyl glycosylphosphotransferase